MHHPPGLHVWRYKGIWIGLTVLMRALSGNYVNFGVFELYGDMALQDALGVGPRLIMPATA